MASSKLPAISDDKRPKSGGMSIVAFILAMFILTLIPAAAGAFFGMQTVSIVKDAQQEKKTDPPKVDPAYTGTMSVKELPDILTDLADPDRAMIRIQAAILFDSKDVANPDVLTHEISDDIQSFLATTSSSQFEGASGLQHLREDLNDRAKTRSDGKVRELIVESLVVQ
jgi:flagellar FliL protein